MRPRLVIPILFLFAMTVSGWAQPAAPNSAKTDISKLIDKLVDVADQDIGYSGSISGGSIFTPLEREGKIPGGLLFQKPPVRSETMRLLVKEGVRAIPDLIAHLDDKRKTKIVINVGMAMPGGGLDINERTETLPAVADKPRAKPIEEAIEFSDLRTLTVGDLCFVAIGQIVNRDYHAASYVPTAMVIINSPSRMPELRGMLKDRWSGLTTKKHRESLIADFLKPDSGERRSGAAKRLGFYYPEVFESTVVRFLRLPNHDSAKVADFVRKALYPAKAAAERKALLDAFVAKNGAQYRDAVMQQLFADLAAIEAPGRSANEVPEVAKDKPSALLVELFNQKKDVRDRDAPPVDSITTDVLPELIADGLVYDRSKKLDQVVNDLMSKSGENDELALACMKRLIGRGYDKEIEAHCRSRLGKPMYEGAKKGYESVLDKLGWTPLHVAVERGDIDSIAELARDRKLLNAAARDGLTALHLAAEAGDLDIVERLVAGGADLNPKDKGGKTAAQIAIHKDLYQIVEFLGKKGCAAPGILVAAAIGKVDAIEAMVKKDPGLLAQKTEVEDQTPLHVAAICKQGPAAERLVHLGAKIEATNKWGMTPLHLAAAFEATDIVKLLIRKGAKVRARATEPPAEPLHLAAANGKPASTDLLVQAGAPVDAEFGPKMTPLHIAAQRGFTAVIDVLLKRGAKVDARMSNGATALHLAAALGHLDTAKKLLGAKAAINAVDDSKNTPLHLAATSGHAPIVRFLLEHGADSRIKDQQEMTPLDVAKEAGNTEVVELLKRHGMKK